MAVVSSAEWFFERILREGAPFLRSLIDSHTPENDWLEFKGAERLHKDKRAPMWSEALAGFANTQGGVLVFGIDARKAPGTEIDAACKLSLTPDPAELRSRLAELHPDATDPPIPGARMEIVFADGTSGPGFVVCYVPESSVKPHRAMLMAGSPYILRVGGRFSNPSPPLLRNLFYPRSSAQLWLDVQPKWAIDEGKNVPAATHVDYRVTIHNSGLVSAREVFVVVHSAPRAMELNPPYGVVQQPTHHDGAGLEMSRTIHPSSAHQLCMFRQQVPVVSQTSPHGISYVPSVETVHFTFRLFAVDTAPSFVQVVLADSDIQMHITRRSSPVIQDAPKANS